MIDMLTPLTKGIITTKLLTEQSGFIDIFIKDQEIVKESDIILHVINLQEIEHILDQMTENIILTKTKNKEILQLELLDARNKLITLKPKQIRQRRGLINGIGSMSKWLFGTMDDEDRQNIQKHIFNINEIINNNNQQIIINNYFNETINHLKTIIKNDKKIIETKINSIDKILDIENDNHIYLEQLSNIQLIKNKIEHLQDNVISAKYGMIHPSILTFNEIEKYKIDYDKLKYIQIGTMFLNNSHLVFGIKIPKTFEIVKLRSIVPIPNNESKEIDYDIEKIFEFDNKIYKFEEHKYLKNLKISTHCIITHNCQLIKNNEFEIFELDIDTIIVKSATNININHTCNSEKIILNGNYLINFNNCSIKIKDYLFSNIVETVEQKQIFNNIDILRNFTNKITFEQIKEEHKVNVRNIKELNFHKRITYSCNILIIIVILTILIIIITKHKHIKIKLNNRIQENSNLKGGEVTYKNADIDKFISSIINK